MCSLRQRHPKTFFLPIVTDVCVTRSPITMMVLSTGGPLLAVPRP